MKATQSIKFIASSMSAIALTCLSSSASEISKFIVECHSFVNAKGDVPKDYSYHLRAFGYAEEIANGININLDEENIVLSVDSKQPDEKEYTALYSKLPLVMRSQQPCQHGKCQQVEYEPKNVEVQIVVTYDKDKGIIFVRHAIAQTIPISLVSLEKKLPLLALETLVQGRGGCQFVALPSKN